VLETWAVTKRYGGIAAVNAVDLQLHEGEILGLIGPNGAGKTTLFDLITGLTENNGGKVFFYGHDVTHLGPDRRAALGLGRSFQDARLFPALTVREALAVAMERRIDIPDILPAAFGLPKVRASEKKLAAEVKEIIELLSLGAFRDKFVSELSTGSRRMVEIGAMLAHEPRVLLLDEPSSGIAQRETEALGPLLRRVQAYMSCSILIIEHDMPLISGLADRLVALESGGVVATGTPAEVLANPVVVESYLGTASSEDLLAPLGSGGLSGEANGSARRRRRRRETPA
jgi:branched-chain amino acid transport system ATP-binding protein